MSTRLRHAFTLVELLVVIGIIALLISILLPSLMSARAAGMNVKCQSNLRQVGVAMRMYAQRFKGRFPQTIALNQTYTAGPVNGSGLTVFWYQRLMIEKDLPGVNDPGKSVTICPADTSPYQPFTMPGEADLFRSSYGINNFMTIEDKNNDGIDDNAPNVQAPPYPRALYGRNPSEKILAADNAQGHLLAAWTPNTVTSGGWHEFDWNRHAKAGARKGVANVLYLDGHVAVVRQGTDAINVLNDVSGMLDAYGIAAMDRAKRQWLAQMK
ncbi:MAG: prepilin-type N-terminal cleavage/methylation domain-containing protein [Tepidisphaeraceae bacterium]